MLVGVIQPEPWYKCECNDGLNCLAVLAMVYWGKSAIKFYCYLTIAIEQCVV